MAMCVNLSVLVLQIPCTAEEHVVLPKPGREL